MKITDYMLIQDSCADMLAISVCEQLKCGYELYGSPYHGQINSFEYASTESAIKFKHYQAMIKYELDPYDV